VQFLTIGNSIYIVWLTIGPNIDAHAVKWLLILV